MNPTFFVVLAVLLHHRSGVTVSAQELTCYQLSECSSSGLVFDNVTMQDCCDNVNGGGSLGSSYQQGDMEGCTSCSIDICASNCFAMNGGGCTQCLQGFLLEGLGCCNCAPDRVRVGDQCLCPPNQVVNPDTGECVPCPGDLLPVDSVCECPPGTLRIGIDCIDICASNCFAMNSGGCTLCLQGFLLEGLGCCNCAPDRVRVGDQCLCPANQVVNPDTGECVPCPGDLLPVNGVCECPPGTLRIGIDCIIVICASNCFAMNGGGCTQCLQGFLLEGLGCCNCAPDRVRVGDQCLCPPNQVVNPDTGECVPCPGDLLPVDSVCECPPGTLRIGIDCIAPPECGQNRNVIFVQDLSQSFSLVAFIGVMQAIEVITATLKAQASMYNVNVATVLYPVYRNGGLRTASRVLFGLSTDCSPAVAELDSLAHNFNFRNFQSEVTRSFEALELILESIIGSITQPTTIMTLTDGPSDTFDSINRINEVVRNIKQIRPDTRFYSAGLETRRDDSFDAELAALGENNPTHTAQTSIPDQAFTRLVIDLMVEASILCPNQRTMILQYLDDNTRLSYLSCVDRNNNFGLVGSCFDPQLCTTFSGPTGGDILQGDAVTIGFINAPYFVSENGSFVDVTVGVLSGTLQTAVSVELSFSDGSAVNGSDFVAQGQVLVFSSSNLLFAVSITPLDDNETEGEESLTASLSFVGAGAVLLDPATAEINIIDNELSEVDFLESTERVTCCLTDDCTGICSEEITTLGQCCSNLLAPVGFSYSLLDQNLTVCTPCPIVIGFANASFAGEERAEDYSVDAGYLSGRPSVEAIFTIGLTLETASQGDIRADSTVVLSPNCLLSAVSLSFTVDGIAQESNERFSLFFRDLQLSNSSLFINSSLVSSRNLGGEIVDSDEIIFALSEEVCEGSEGEGVVSVTILKIIEEQDVMLDNPVSFKIIPLTVCEASGRRFITRFEPDNSLSPNRADIMDFDANPITIEFLPGVASVAANISIRDDEVNEAMNQTFIVHLEIESAVNPNLITLSRRDSNCTIVDNDNIQIGFARASYSFLEPSTSLQLITTVELVRDRGCQSEQTFQVQVSVGPPSSGANAATLRSTTMGNDYDYSPVSLELQLEPLEETVPFSFILNFDDLSEGQEAFQATLSAVESFSGGTFQPATTNFTFQSTEIHILDYNDDVDMPETRVTCYMNTECSEDFSITTRQSCCNNLEDPLGFSYHSAEYTCEQCPTVFGFSPENFTEMERDQAYTVRVGFLSGRPLGNQGLSFTVEFINDTAGEEDIEIRTDQVDIQPPLDLVSEVMFRLVDDEISQEGNETFSIELKRKISSDNIIGAPRVTAQLYGTIIDRDRVTIQLSAPEFTREAPNATMTIRISKSVTLANPVFFRIIPLTADEAERRADVLNFNCPPDDDFSPCRADKTDFDGTALNVTFPADEGLQTEEFLDTFINIFDDEVDEAEKQRFVAYLELLDAVDLNLIEITRDAAICIIADNDDTRIGFAEQAYTFNEPDAETQIMEVTLIREGGSLSEQTFGVKIIVNNPTGDTRPATLESDDINNSDFRINSTDNFLRLRFPAEVHNITFEFFLKSDEFPEGVEAFQATATPLEGFPTFQPPQGEGAFESTEIRISDENDRVVLGFVSSEDIVLSETQSGGAVQLEFGVLEGYLSFRVLMNAEFSIAGGETNFTLTGNETRTINVSLMEEFEDREVDNTPNVTYIGQVTTRAPYPNIVLVNNTVMIVVVDDDVEIGFMNNETTMMVSEGDMQVVLVVQVLDGQVPEGVVVNVFFQTIPGSATASKDYTTTSDTLIFTGTQSHSINISLMEDREIEEDEEFFGVLSILNSDPRVQLKNPNITITIMDASNEAGASSGIDITIPIVSSIAFALILLIFFLAVIIICAQRMKKSKEMAINEIELDKYESSAMRVRKTYRVKVPKNLMINSCNLQLNDPVGQGEFGIVYKARLSKGFNQSFGEVVAVKTLKGFLEQSVVRDLLKECTKMSTLDHPNVLTLIGVCVDGGPAPYIVMPFMFNGSLLAHLKKERENLVIPHDQQEERDTIAISAKLMDMSLQVAKGMEYLASKRLIHRDLAARNCMIDMNFVIKVADFGLSESTGNYKDYFRQEKSEGVKLPVKWLAPECLSDGVFSEKSDVWAFGVTCWEIFSGGKVPYAGINPMELPRMLENGYRMEMPSNSACTDAMSKMMTQCWAATAKDRPTFCGIVISFSRNLESISGYMGVCKEKNDSMM